jgi:hypothetical protein
MPSRVMVGMAHLLPRWSIADPVHLGEDVRSPVIAVDAITITAYDDADGHAAHP